MSERRKDEKKIKIYLVKKIIIIIYVILVSTSNLLQEFISKLFLRFEGMEEIKIA